MVYFEFQIKKIILILVKSPIKFLCFLRFELQTLNKLVFIRKQKAESKFC